MNARSNLASPNKDKTQICPAGQRCMLQIEEYPECERYRESLTKAIILYINPGYNLSSYKFQSLYLYKTRKYLEYNHEDRKKTVLVERGYLRTLFSTSFSRETSAGSFRAGNKRPGMPSQET